MSHVDTNDTSHANALRAARATFWQTLGGSAVLTIPFGQAATWGDLGGQAAALGLAAAGAVGAALIAGAGAYARWRGGTPSELNN